MKKLLSLSVLIAMFAFISCTEVRDSAGNDENSSATPEKTTYTVTFNSNDETNKSYTQTFVSGESQLLNENCFTRTGYNFAGWNTKRNGYGTSYSDRARLTATYDITLYAQWIYVGSQDTPDNPVKTYTVTFNSNDGTNKEYTQIFVKGEAQYLNVNCFVRNGYTFVCWNTSSDGYGSSYADKRAITIYSDKTLYAQWTYIGNEEEPDPNPNPNPNPDNPVQTYTVKFDANGGSGEMFDISLTYDVAEQLPANTFYRTDYKFVGWATTPNGSVFYTDEEDVLNITTKDKTTMTLYAKWLELYTITYELDGGTNADSNPEKYTVETEDIILAEATRKCYTFAGWYIDEECSGGITEITKGTTGDITLYAKWIANNYTVAFDANGGTGKMPSQVFTFGTLQPLNSNTSKCTGCTFKEWNTKPDGSGDSYIAGESYTFGEDTTLYAQWTANKVGITVMLPEYNDAEINLQQVTNENTVTFTAADGFDSYGWYIDGEKQSETSATFAIDILTMNPANYKVMVIVADGDEYYSATADLEVKRVQ